MANPAAAADRDFVGVLALAVDSEVAVVLELSTEQMVALEKIVQQREQAVLPLALEIKDLDAQTRAERLAPFVAESERLGLAALTDQQRDRLERMRVARKGLLTLAEARVAERLGLSGEQQQNVDQILARRAGDVAGSRPDQASIIKAVYERKLAAVLTEEQRVLWERMSTVPSDGDDERDAVADEQEEDDIAAATTKDPRGETDDGAPSPPPTVAAGTVSVDDRASQPDDAVDAPAADGKLRFSFRYAPWPEVLDWFSTTASLSLQADAPPPGTFNYTDSRRYTPAEALDVLNSILLTKGYTLVRREKALILINLEDGIPPNLVPQISAAELDQRGDFELVSILFSLDVMTPEEAETEVKKLLGPQGSVIVLPKAKQVFVTETAGRLRTIRNVIDAVETPELTSDQKLTVYQLEHATGEEVLAMVRQLLGLPEGSNAAPDGSLRLAVDPLTGRLVATGKLDAVARVAEIVKLVDVPVEADDAVGNVLDLPQLEVYTTGKAEPNTVLQVLQTLLAGNEDVRLTVDDQTGNLVALARLSEHASIRATIDQMQRDGRQIEVLQLRIVDPQLAVLAINKLFGAGDGKDGAPSAPKVDADLTSRQLLIRGTQAQIDEIRSLMEKMGERDMALAADDVGERSRVRMIPLDGASTRDLLKQIEMVWPTVRSNRIKVVTPSAIVPSLRSGKLQPEVTPKEDPPGRAPLREDPLRRRPEGIERFEFPPQSSRPKATPAANVAPGDKAAGNNRRAIFRFAGDANATENTNTNGAAEDLPVIVVSPGPNGLMIASEDLDALDAFEDLVHTLAARVAERPNYTVFYLKFAKARVASELLKEILGAGSGGDGGEGGSLLGDLAGAAIGDLGGGLMGNLLGIGGGVGDSPITTIGSISFVADSRLNAIIAEGSPADVDLVEQLLRVIDQESSPEDVQTLARPRIIPVFNTSAEDIAKVIREIYAEKLSAGSGRQRQPSPEEFMRALRGGNRGGGGGSKQAEEEQVKMTLGVDARNNALVVGAPEPLFQEVKLLVEQLDQVRDDSRQTMRVVTLKRSDPATVQKAIASIVGDKVKMSTTKAPTNGSQPAAASSQPGTTRERNDAQRVQEIQRRIEFFNALQRAGQRQGGPSGRGGRRGDSPGRGGPARPGN